MENRFAFTNIYDHIVQPVLPDLNARSHCVHLKSLDSECILWCAFKLLEVVKSFEHFSH